MKVLFIGGDLRNIEILKYFNKLGYDVDLIGYEKINYFYTKNLSEHISHYDIIVLPINGIKDNNECTSKFSQNPIYIEDDILQKISKNCLVFTGLITEKLKKLNKNIISLINDEDIKKENGIITSEGVIMDIIQNTDFSIHNSKILVIGFGNVGKPLVKVLESMGSNVFVGVKNKNDILNELYFSTKDIEKFIKFVKQSDVIINSAPELTLDKNILEFINPDTYIVDVSSYPYGIDLNHCRNMNKNVTLLPGIPGIIAPKSAGKILTKKIDRTIKGDLK